MLFIKFLKCSSQLPMTHIFEEFRFLTLFDPVYPIPSVIPFWIVSLMYHNYLLYLMSFLGVVLIKDVGNFGPLNVLNIMSRDIMLLITRPRPIILDDGIVEMDQMLLNMHGLIPNMVSLKELGKDFPIPDLDNNDLVKAKRILFNYINYEIAHPNPQGEYETRPIVSDMLFGMKSNNSKHDINTMINSNIKETTLKLSNIGVNLVLSSAITNSQQNFVNYVNKYALDMFTEQSYDDRSNLLKPDLSDSTINLIKFVTMKYLNSKYNGFHVLVLKNKSIAVQLANTLNTSDRSTVNIYMDTDEYSSKTNTFQQNYFKSQTDSVINNAQKTHPLPTGLNLINDIFGNLLYSMVKKSNGNELKMFNIEVIDISNASRADLNDYNQLVHTGNILNIKYDGLDNNSESMIIFYANDPRNIDTAILNRINVVISNESDMDNVVNEVERYALQHSYLVKGKLTFSINKNKASNYQLLHELVKFIVHGGRDTYIGNRLIYFIIDRVQTGDIMSIEQWKQML